MEFHIVVVGRSGHQNAVTRVYLLGPANKRSAIRTSEATYRQENNLASSVAVNSRCVFSGSEGDGRGLMVILEGEMKVQNA